MVAAFDNVRAVKVAVLVGLFLVTWIIPGVVLNALRMVILGMTEVWGSRRWADRAPFRG